MKFFMGRWQIIHTRSSTWPWYYRVCLGVLYGLNWIVLNPRQTLNSLSTMRKSLHTQFLLWISLLFYGRMFTSDVSAARPSFSCKTETLCFGEIRTLQAKLLVPDTHRHYSMEHNEAKRKPEDFWNPWCSFIYHDLGLSSLSFILCETERH